MKLTKFALITIASMALSIQVSALSNVHTESIAYNSSYTATVGLANDKIHSEEAVSGMLPQNTQMAINGGFFNSYCSNKNFTYPSNYPQTFSAIIKDGDIINGSGDNNMIGFSYDGKVLIDRVLLQPYVYLNHKETIKVWGVNKVYPDATAVYIMTDDFPYSFDISSGAMVFTVKDNIITDVSTATTQTVATGTSKIVYNQTIVGNATKWNSMPKVGDTFEITHTITPKNSGDWSSIKTAINGGRMLVINGVNIAADTAYNSQYDVSDKQSLTSSAQRSYIYTKADGTLYFETSVGSFSEIANYLVSNGATYAISVDGGASSMLYSKDSGYKTPVGRNLSTILAITPADGTSATDKPTAPKPQTPPPAVSNTKDPSDWAVADMKRAIDLKLIPAWLQGYYQSPITRLEFCNLLTTFIPEKTQNSIYLYINELNLPKPHFTDTADYHVLTIASLGIVNGKGDGTFDPNGLLTRQEAATMLNRLVDVIGTAESYGAQTFADQSSIESWATENVDKITSYKIMNGDGTNFDPNGTYTKEQAYKTMLNVYDFVTCD